MQNRGHTCLSYELILARELRAPFCAIDLVVDSLLQSAPRSWGCSCCDWIFLYHGSKLELSTTVTEPRPWCQLQRSRRSLCHCSVVRFRVPASGPSEVSSEGLRSTWTLRRDIELPLLPSHLLRPSFFVMTLQSDWTKISPSSADIPMMLSSSKDYHRNRQPCKPSIE